MLDVSTDLGLPAVPDTQDENLYGELLNVYQALAALAVTLDTYTGNTPDISGLSPAATLTAPKKARVKLSEDVSKGTLLNFHEVSGELRARKAGGASVSTKRTHAISDSSGTAGSEISVIVFGYCRGHFSGMTTGSTYYTSDTTAGQMSAGPASGSRQALGFAVTSTDFFFNPMYLVI